MQHAETVTFGTSGLDRAAHLRGDDAALQAALDDPKGGVLALWRGKPLFVAGTGDLAWMPADHALFDGAKELIFLGLDDGAPRFARAIPDWPMDALPDTLNQFLDPSEQTHPAVGEGAVFAELRARMTDMTPRAAELAATAKAVGGWHRSHRFCARCGERSQSAMAGWQRDCPACGGKHFPRTDPVVIMLITHGNNVLLGRSPGWPEGMFSLLAGFVEPGETMEAAVRRETLEEAGIEVGTVRYLSSQPWPFPASLMFGCEGLATSTEITLDPNELEAARWVSREDMADALAGRHPDIAPARKGAIARFLIEAWLADKLD